MAVLILFGIAGLFATGALIYALVGKKSEQHTV